MTGNLKNFAKFLGSKQGDGTTTQGVVRVVFFSSREKKRLEMSLTNLETFLGSSSIQMKKDKKNNIFIAFICYNRSSFTNYF